MVKKKTKLSTPAWILEGYDSPAEYEKAQGKKVEKKKIGKTFKIRECPKCGSDNVGVVIGEVGVWECKKCCWKGDNVVEKELDEDEFMKYLDEKGEDVS